MNGYLILLIDFQSQMILFLGISFFRGLVCSFGVFVSSALISRSCSYMGGAHFFSNFDLLSSIIEANMAGFGGL